MMHLYEYAVIRFVPRVERDEFFNIGLIVFCKRQRFVRVAFEVNRTKFDAFQSEVDWDSLQSYVAAFQNTANGLAQTGPIGLLEVDERFRWLTAVRSSCIQTSRPHPGKTSDLNLCFNRLFEQTVL